MNRSRTHTLGLQQLLSLVHLQIHVPATRKNYPSRPSSLLDLASLRCDFESGVACLTRTG